MLHWILCSGLKSNLCKTIVTGNTKTTLTRNSLSRYPTSKPLTLIPKMQSDQSKNLKMKFNTWSSIRLCIRLCMRTSAWLVSRVNGIMIAAQNVKKEVHHPIRLVLIVMHSSKRPFQDLSYRSKLLTTLDQSGPQPSMNLHRPFSKEKISTHWKIMIKLNWGKKGRKESSRSSDSELPPRGNRKVSNTQLSGNPLKLTSKKQPLKTLKESCSTNDWLPSKRLWIINHTTIIELISLCL